MRGRSAYSRAEGGSALERVDVVGFVVRIVVVGRGLRREVERGVNVDLRRCGGRLVDDRAQAQAAQGDDASEGPTGGRRCRRRECGCRRAWRTGEGAVFQPCGIRDARESSIPLMRLLQRCLLPLRVPRGSAVVSAHRSRKGGGFEQGDLATDHASGRRRECCQPRSGSRLPRGCPRCGVSAFGLATWARKRIMEGGVSRGKSHDQVLANRRDGND